jgi:hypothetical protein
MRRVAPAARRRGPGNSERLLVNVFVSVHVRVHLRVHFRVPVNRRQRESDQDIGMGMRTAAAHQRLREREQDIGMGMRTEVGRDDLA